MFSTPTPVTKRWQQNQQKLDLTQRTTLSRQRGAPSACREPQCRHLLTLNYSEPYIFGGFYPLLALFLPCLRWYSWEIGFHWCSLLWLFIFDHSLFFSQGKGCSACITAMQQPCSLKINIWNSSVKISFNLLRVQAFRNNFPGWDCLLFSGPLAQEES